MSDSDFFGAGTVISRSRHGFGTLVFYNYTVMLSVTPWPASLGWSRSGIAAL